MLFFQGHNPLYKGATSTFTNITYRGKDWSSRDLLKIVFFSRFSLLCHYSSCSTVIVISYMQDVYFLVCKYNGWLCVEKANHHDTCRTSSFFCFLFRGTKLRWSSEFLITCVIAANTWSPSDLFLFYFFQEKNCAVVLKLQKTAKHNILCHKDRKKLWLHLCTDTGVSFHE